MELNVATNVVTADCELLTGFELLAWLNETLRLNLTEVEQTCTGAAYCQLIERVFPNCLDLSSIRFQISSTEDVTHNYNLLQAAFKKVGVVRYVPVEKLKKRNSRDTLNFLLWFRKFFMENVNKEKKDTALGASGGKRMHPQRVKDKTKTPVKPGSSSGSSKDKPDVVIQISDGEDEVTEAKQSVGDMLNKESGDVLLHFLRKYCHDSMNPKLNTAGDPPVDGILSPTHPNDIIEACSRLPYCLYLYVGLELGRGQNMSVVLVGYHDQTLGVSVVKPLLTLQMSVNELTPADGDAADADARLLIEALKKSGLILSGVAAFYCNASHPEVSQVFLSQLQAFSPMLVSLCGLPGMAGRACHAGISASFSSVAELVRDIHYHYYSSPSVSNSLKGLFASAGSYNPSHPISAQCFFIHVVQEMVRRWRSLVDYFKSMRQAKDADRIRAQLMDHKVRLRFIFLSQTLEPLRALQKLQQFGTFCVATELQLASTVVRSYATSVLLPEAADRFFRRRDPQILQYRTALLSTAQVRVGDQAREFMWATAVVDLGEEERRDFKTDAVTFYKATLQSLAESLPEHLGEVSLKNISTLLKHSEDLYRKKLMKGTLLDVAIQLGLFKADTREENQLFCHYSRFIQSVKGESGWAKILQCTRPHSSLRRLFLTLLALPSSLHRARLFAQVFNRDPPPIQDPPTALLRSCSWEDDPYISKLRKSARAGFVVERAEGSKDRTSSEGAGAKHSLPPKSSVMKEESDNTDNSSDVVEVIEEPKTKRSCGLVPAETSGGSQKVGEDDDDDGPVIPRSTPPDSAELLDLMGELVWVLMEGSSPWPAIIMTGTGEIELPGMRTVKWYGQRISSLMSLQALKPFAAFAQHFSPSYFAVSITYREAVILSLQEAARRCKKEFSPDVLSQEELQKGLLDWAFGGFLPTGPDGFKPTAATLSGMNMTGLTKMITDNKPEVKQKVFLKTSSSSAKSGTGACEEGEGERNDRAEINGEKVQKKKSSLLDEFDDVPRKKKTCTSSHNKDKQESSTYTQPDQKVREKTIRRIMDMQLDIDGFCLCCGTEDVDISHPLFKGSLCSECAENLRETLYLYDEDGYQSYCTICCYGMEVLLCGHDSCCRTYCEDCLNILVGPGTFESLKQLDPWICYLCQHHQSHGALVPREDWSVRVKELFAKNSDRESVSSTEEVMEESASQTKKQDKGGLEGGEVQKKKISLSGDMSSSSSSSDLANIVPCKKRTCTQVVMEEKGSSEGSGSEPKKQEKGGLKGGMVQKKKKSSLSGDMSSSSSSSSDSSNIVPCKKRTSTQLVLEENGSSEASVSGAEMNKQKEGGEVQKKSSLSGDMSSSSSSSSSDSSNIVPHKKRTCTKSQTKVNQRTSTYTQPDQKVREETIRRIMDMQLDIDGFCLCCGTEDVDISHPLFKGSLCSECAENLRETLYLYDEDGYQSYCTICCYGMEVLLCGHDSCCRTYCEDCLNILVGPGTFESLKQLDPWICYLCQPHQSHGALVPREDWSVRVKELFAKNSDRESVSSTKEVMEESASSEGSESGSETRRENGGWNKKKRRRRSKVQKKMSSLFDESDDDMSPDFVPHKKRTYTKSQTKVNQRTSTYTQPDQKVREETICRIMDMQLDIDGFCLCCGTEDVDISHPLFKGSLCSECADNLRETLYLYDEDGYQSYCTICCYGMEVLLCGHDSCCRTYCEDCLNILVGPGTFESLKQLDPWICYLCQPHQSHGALVPREDWSVRVQELFANNSAMEFEPHRVYPSIPANLRRPIRVLSLFDGIATGYLVLKDLGFKVGKYVASEICTDSLAVATINHNGKIIHVNDVRHITPKHLQQWGPFDLLIGGSPCNDLSIVNPNRKGLYEGTGRLFFDYYRILQLLKPEEDDPRPFFWLFENVVFMNLHDKFNICRFLECNPVLVDAVRVSPAHRARCFWGNIPGMSRPITASSQDKLKLQDCLEIGREARVTKVRTITTNPYSLRQGKGFSQLPVLQDGKVDNLWITEVEKIFGFPKHYTDVRNMNRQQRQTVLGKSWSVPVIRHLFAPLKDYFACEELPPLATSTTSSSPLTSSPSSPELQQLR